MAAGRYLNPDRDRPNQTIAHSGMFASAHISVSDLITSVSFSLLLPAFAPSTDNEHTLASPNVFLVVVKPVGRSPAENDCFKLRREVARIK